jgi:hypothetical protein
MEENKPETVTVSESKFNGTATFNVEGAESIEEAKDYARKFWVKEYNTRPSRIVAEEDSPFPNMNRYHVMVADHSSGSLKQSKQYEV